MDVRLNFVMDIIEQVKKKLKERPIDRVEITSLLLQFESEEMIAAAVDIRRRSLIANDPSGAINALGVHLLNSLSMKKVKGFEEIRPALRDMYLPPSNTKRKAVKRKPEKLQPNKPTQRSPKPRRRKITSRSKSRQYRRPDDKNALQIFTILKMLEGFECLIPRKDKLFLNSFKKKFYSEPDYTHEEYRLVNCILDSVQRQIKEWLQTSRKGHVKYSGN